MAVKPFGDPSRLKQITRDDRAPGQQVPGARGPFGEPVGSPPPTRPITCLEVQAESAAPRRTMEM
ncbi:hypothetical protein [Allokutzneria oryzae]|uniref:Uncharacterized protein n=1 Tax=Allokutzneria oryzae TaxID=1378989 RepID=A0ABV5ZTR2_9PSEU